MNESKRQSRPMTIAIAVIVLIALSYLIHRGRTWMWNESAYSGLKGLCLAMHQYHDEWGRFPPIEWTNAKGARLSYRVLAMSHFHTAEARAVAKLSFETASASDLERSDEFRRWRLTEEGQSILSPFEFVPIQGKWPTWGHSITESRNEEWNGDGVPLIAAVAASDRSLWCGNVNVATAPDNSTVLELGGRTVLGLYVTTDCSAHVLESSR